jgi:hypothetical protein
MRERDIASHRVRCVDRRCHHHRLIKVSVFSLGEILEKYLAFNCMELSV